MKNRMITFLLSIFMVLSLAGCGKTSVSVTFENVGVVEVIDGNSIKNGGVGNEYNVLKLNTSKDGEYPLTVLLDGQECKVTITVEDGNATITTEPDVEFTAIIK